jgi:hypothetical protein
MNELNPEHQNPEKEGPGEVLVELTEETGKEELKGKRIITLLTVIAAAVNIVVLAIPWDGVAPVSLIGLILSVVILIGILLLGLLWKSKPDPPPVVNVQNITATVGTPCSPNGGVRIAREAGTPPATAWVIVRTFTQKSLLAGAKKYVPSTRFLTYGFIDVTRTLNYTCQKQVCQNGTWANQGASYACNVVQNKTFQVTGGPGVAPLQGWTDGAIRQSFGSGYYQ